MQDKVIENIDFDFYVTELWTLVCLYLCPEQIFCMSLVNKAFKRICENNVIWENKSSLHFFSHYENDKNIANINWFNSFKNHYKNNVIKNADNDSQLSLIYYRMYIPDKNTEFHIKKLFSLVKEKDVKSLKTYNIQPHYLDLKDQDITLLMYVRNLQSQELLDYFYQEIKKYYIRLSEGYFWKTKLDYLGRTIFYWSVQLNQPFQICIENIQQENDIRLPDKDDMQPIHIACALGHIQLIQFLLNKSPDLCDPPDSSRFTPIFYATRFGHLEVVKLLLNEYEVSLELIDSRYSVIHEACQYGKIKIVHFLLEKDPQALNKTDSLNQTPILWAASRGHSDIVELLLRLQGNINIFSLRGLTPLSWAVSGGHSKVIELLSDHDAIYDNQCALIHGLCREGNLKMLQSLLKKKPTLLNYPDTLNQTPVLWAASRGHTDIVEFLASLGAELNKAGQRRNWTPLHWAAKGDHRTTVKVLLKYKASSLLISTENKTADKVSKDPYIKDLIALDRLICRIENNENLIQENISSFNFFGRFGVKKIVDISAYLDAAHALKAFLMGDAKVSILDKYKDALLMDELAPIYHNVLKHFDYNKNEFICMQK